MSIFVAIALVLLASTLMNIAIVLLREWVVRLTDEEIRAPIRLPAALFRSKFGIAGISLMAMGHLFFTVALSAQTAPISVLQPLTASGVLVAATLAVIFLRERFGALEWLGLALLLVGVTFLGVSIGTTSHANMRLESGRLLAMMGSCVLAILPLLGVIATSKTSVAEIAYGIAAGILLGFGYLCTKAFFMAWDEEHWHLAAILSLAMVLGSAGGFIVLLVSFRRWRLLIVTTVNFVVNQALVVAGGWWCLGEEFPAETFALSARFLGLGLILVGIVILATMRSPRAETV